MKDFILDTGRFLFLMLYDEIATYDEAMRLGTIWLSMSVIIITICLIVLTFSIKTKKEKKNDK